MQTKPKPPGREKKIATLTRELRPRRFTCVVSGNEIIFADKGAVKITIEREIRREVSE